MARRKGALKGTRLNIGCGNSPRQEGWVGIDKRKTESADFVHDLNEVPWPIPSDSMSMALMSHVMEHLDPSKMIDIFDEIWRIMAPMGQLLVAVPYAGSHGGYQDPTHVRPGFNETTFEYFCPEYDLYNIYRPQPWKIIKLDYVVGHYVNVVMEALKRDLTPVKVKGSRRAA